MAFCSFCACNHLCVVAKGYFGSIPASPNNMQDSVDRRYFGSTKTPVDCSSCITQYGVGVDISYFAAFTNRHGCLLN